MTSKDSLKDIAADLREDARQIHRAREIALRMTPQPTLRGRFLDEIFEAYADRLEAALKRGVDSIHRAMVLIAGIEMENPENPPRLWTALEDAYNALSDALGTDGDTTADEEEAKATGRHFVVKPYGSAAALREALLKAIILLKVCEWPDDTPMQDVAEVIDEIEKASSATASELPKHVAYVETEGGVK